MFLKRFANNKKKPNSLTTNPNFWIILAYFRAANRLSASLLAPVQTILPELKINAVVRGSRIRIITAANRFGLYSALRACKAIFFKSNLQLKLTVETIFLRKKMHYEENQKENTNSLLTVIVVKYRDPQSRESLESLAWPDPSFDVR